MAELKKYKLGEVVDFFNGKQRPYTFGKYPLFGGNGIIDYVGENNFEDVIIIGRVGANCGCIQICNEKCWVSDNAISACVKKGFEKYFVYYLLICLDLNTKHIGAAQPLITQSILSELPVFVPPIATQRHISSVLFSIDSKISLNRKMNRTLEAMAKQLYDYWFVQFDFPDENGKPYKSSGGKMVWNEVLKREIPEEWKIGKVKDCIEPIERGISYSSNDILDPNGLAMLNLACFSKQGEYRIGELKHYSGSINDKYIYPFDMLIACTDMTQDADVIGRPILATKEYDYFTYTMDLAKISPKYIRKMYLYYTLRTSYYHKYIKPFASGTNVKHLNVNGVENYIIPIPPNEIQTAYENIVSAIKEQQMLMINEQHSLTRQRDKLLPLLMNGQVTVE